MHEKLFLKNVEIWSPIDRGGVDLTPHQFGGITIVAQG